jgi:hypothetical protein
MLIGYARVSATHQNLDRQIAMLKAEGCKRIFKEKLSGREGVRRPQLDKAIEALGTGDILVLAEWDRVTRSMLDYRMRGSARRNIQGARPEVAGSHHADRPRHFGLPVIPSRGRASSHPGTRERRASCRQETWRKVRT